MIAALLLASALSVFAQSPELKWVDVQDGKGLEIGIDLIKTADGNVVAMTDYASSASYLTTTFSKLSLADASKTALKTFGEGPADTSGVNGNSNMLVYKLDANTGNMLWSLQSNIGNFDGKGCMTATADNGVLLFLKIRHTSLGHMHKDVLLQLVDDHNNLTTIKWDYPEDYKKAPYRPILVKVDAEGKVEWYKHYDVDFGPYIVDGQKYDYTDNFDLGGIATDAEGNIYVSGMYRTSIDFGAKAHFRNPRNAAKWDGKTQNNRGDIFVAKLNPQGEAIWGMTSAGDTITIENPQDMVIEGNTIYLTGTIQGDGKSTIKLGDVALTPGDRKSVFAASFSTADGSCHWAKTMRSENNKGCKRAYAKPMGLNVVKGNVYMYGSFQGDIMNGDEVAIANDKNQLHGYIIKCGAQDGNYLNGIHIGPAAGTAMDILEIEDVTEIAGKVFASGYGLFSSSYTYLLDSQLSPESLQQFIVKTAKNGTTQAGVLVDDKIISLTRLKENATVPGMNGTYISEGASTPWAVMLTAHSINSIVSMNNLKDNVVYDAAEDKNYDIASYTRNFKHNKWQSLYLPFGMEYADWSEDFEIARINNVHQYDEDNDGLIDKTALEVILLPEGSRTEANVPYMIKAKHEGYKTLTADNVLVEAAAPYEHDVTSWNTRFIFHGTYDGVTGDDMFNNKYYAFADGGLKQVSQPVPMKGYRWYLDIQDRAGEKLPTAKAISLIILDEEGNVTGVEEVELDGNAAAGNGYSAGVYNLQGQKVRDNADDLVGLPKGVYIINGKKVIL